MAATIKDVAKLAGVSTATVSYVVNGTNHISEGTRQRVFRAIEKLEYMPSALARGLRVQRTRTVGLILPQLANLYFTEAANGIEKMLQKNGYSLIISESGDNPQTEKKLIRVFNSLLIDGLIMVPCGHRQSDLKDILRGNYPTVFLDRRPNRFDGDAVVLNNFAATYEAVKLLLESGRTRVGMVLGPSWSSTSKDRLRGYRKAHKELGVEVDSRLIRYGDYGLESGLQLCSELFRDEAPAALFAASSNMTLGAFLAAKQMGLRIPKQLAILGCDDLAWAGATVPALSMIFQPSYELGKKAAEQLLKRIDNPAERFETIYMTTELRLRDST